MIPTPFNPTPDIIEQGPISDVGGSSRSSKAFTTMKRKVPLTTARRKGIVITESMSEGSNSLSQGVKSRRQNSLAVNLSADDVCFDFDLEDDQHDYVPDDDGGGGGSEPTDDDDNDEEDDEDDDVSLDDEDEDDVGNIIHDNFDPFEDFLFIDGDDGDNYFMKLYRNGELYKDEAFGKIELKPWQIFTDKKHLRDVVRDYCIQCGFSIIVDRATNSRYTVRCASVGCEWRLHASRLPDGITWAIKSIQNSEHTCCGLDINNPMVSSSWAARVLLEDVRANNDISAKSLNAILFQRYGVNMATSTLYRVRKQALDKIHGSHDESYGFLPKYCEMVKSTNPGSSAICCWFQSEEIERPLVFKSIFISFRGVLDGLKGCRSLVGVDGAHLTGNYGGVLLSAVALDANNELYPFAWAIVGSEDAESWGFFIWHLQNILKDLGRGDTWCIISDRQKGIEAALNEVWPECDRRYCCKHISANWKKSFPGPLLFSIFWRACNAYSPFTFKKAMEQLDKLNPAGRIWLSKLGDQSTWTKHKFSTDLKSDVNISNFVESFNSTLGIDRNRPVLTLLEGIRRNTMVRIASRRQKCNNWRRDDICPNIIRRVQELSHDSRACVPYMCGEGEYEVVDGKSTLPVSLNYRTCLCGAWQLTGIPCKHGIRAIIHARLDPHSFVHEWYSVRKYREAYSCGIKSIPDVEQWPEINMPHIKPPPIKRAPGRPCRNRKRADDEQRKGKRAKTVKCSKCKAFGHNSATCKGGLTAKQKASQPQKKQQHQASCSKPKKGGQKSSI